jgi:hypothetical protein
MKGVEVLTSKKEKNLDEDEHRGKKKGYHKQKREEK